MREELLNQLERPANQPWDIAIIGGGCVGLGAAMDAVSRGHSCVLLEQSDFGKGTSSRSTKLIHGGVRYLAQGNVSLVREALHERGLLLKNAPDLVKPLRFIVPCYSLWERWYYAFGMKCYDALAGRLGIERSRQLSTDKLLSAVPGLSNSKLRGGVAYFDAQFDDARLLIGVAKKVHALGGLPINYMRVAELKRQEQHVEQGREQKHGQSQGNGRIVGLVAEDTETRRRFEVHAKVVINAAGAFSDDIRRMESSSAPPMIAPSQGIHLVVDKAYLGGDDAIMIPKTKDGRVLFAIPWLGRAILGTTDTAVPTAELEPQPLEDEVTYLLEHFGQYFSRPLRRDDVLSVYAGLRPLVKPKQEAGTTSKISREHRIVTSAGGLLSILGGKWTTFRKMAEDVIDAAEQAASLTSRSPQTREMKIEAGIGTEEEFPANAPTKEQVVQAVRHEFARTVEDILARRFRLLLTDARQSSDAAPEVARVMAEELGQDTEWEAEQIRAFQTLTKQYQI